MDAMVLPGIIAALALVIIASVWRVSVLSRVSQQQQESLTRLEQRLAASEQMQGLLARAHRQILNRAHAQSTPASETSPYDRADALIAQGCEAPELARSLSLPLEEAEMMVQLGRLKQSA